MMKSSYPEIEEKMQRGISFLLSEFNTIRAGRANAAILDKVTVEYYGTETPINQTATISVPDPRMLVVQPWDVNLLKDIEKAILKSDLGITPVNDGKVIRLSFPPLTEERRKEYVKLVGKKSEEAKVVIRNIRREALENEKKKEKQGEITEDDLKIAEKEIQDLTDKYIKIIDEETKKKEKEILEI